MYTNIIIYYKGSGRSSRFGWIRRNRTNGSLRSTAKQWEHLAACLGRCLVLADRPKGDIFVAWYAHTTTGREAGVQIRPTTANADDDAKLETAVEWAGADFGFRFCLIFRVDILSTDVAGV